MHSDAEGRQQPDSAGSHTTCDYLVVGGGAAGCIVARRLADQRQAQVILLEAGPPDEGDPLATRLSLLDGQDASYDWNYTAFPTRRSPSPIRYARARMLGGCANHNDCAFLAPFASDLERWVELGAAGWDAVNVASSLMRVEESLHIESSPPGTVLSRAFIDTAVNLGLEEHNFRDYQGPGCGWFPLNALGDLRQSSSIAYLHPLAESPDNLRVLTEVKAQRLIIENRIAKGVQTSLGAIWAKREIILCTGSINTPKLLMLSGVGPATHLQEMDIPVVHNLPGVGQNLTDHVAANIACELKTPCPPWDRTPCEATALIKLDPSSPAPEVLFHFVLTLREKHLGRTFFGDQTRGIKISPNVTRPRSRGNVCLGGSDPDLPPVIDLNYLSDPGGHDQRILLQGLRFARKLAAERPLSQWIEREIYPGPDVQTDQELRAAALESCETVYHPAGTCRMGAAGDPGSVVTPDLKVKGLHQLRIADASVFPDMVTVNICNTVMMVAEKAAELICGPFEPGQDRKTPTV